MLIDAIFGIFNLVLDFFIEIWYVLFNKWERCI